MASQILPISNEIVSVLTASGVATFSSPYQHSPDKLLPTVSKMLIDFAALSGIMMSCFFFIIIIILPLLDSVVCPSGPHPPLLLAKRPNRGHIGGPSCGTCL